MYSSPVVETIEMQTEQCCLESSPVSTLPDMDNNPIYNEGF